MRRFLATLCALACLVLATVAHAGFLINSFQFGGAAPPPAFSYRNSYADTSNASSYTFTAADTGTAHALRVNIVGAVCPSANISAMTINGVAATQVVESEATDDASEIWQAANPTGTTGDIVLTVSAATSCLIHVWAGYPASATAEDSGGQAMNGGNDGLVSDLAKTSGGFVVMMGYVEGARTFTFSQTGAETFTENYDGAIEGSTVSGAASFIVTATTTTDDMIYTLNGNNNHNSVAASWGP